MRRDKVVYLISQTLTQDSIKNQIETPTERMVFATELAVGSGEFYNAAVTGLKPTKRFEIYTREYQGEAQLKHENITYKIIRTEGRGEDIRLSCERA